MPLENSELQYLISKLEDLREKVVEIQKSYKRDVDDLYKKMGPFDKPREDGRDSFIEEIEILLEMVGHCIVLDSPRILYEYAIDKISNKPSLLACSDDLGMYVSAFAEAYEESDSEIEKFYLGKLINEFRVLGGSQETSTPPNATVPTSLSANEL
jgi:hypothetical protein